MSLAQDTIFKYEEAFCLKTIVRFSSCVDPVAFEPGKHLFPQHSALLGGKPQTPSQRLRCGPEIVSCAVYPAEQ